MQSEQRTLAEVTKYGITRDEVTESSRPVTAAGSGARDQERHARRGDGHRPNLTAGARARDPERDVAAGPRGRST